jgi:uncharacterized protein
LCIFYAAGLTLLFQKPAWRSRVLILAPVGSMALSNYLFHSVVAIPIFYGLGLGLFSRVSLIVAVAIALGIYATQTVLTRVWLQYAAYGPVEWIWRQFTYGRRFPLLRQDPA